MKQKFIFTLALLLFFSPQKASAFCNSMRTQVYITTNPGIAQYITTKSRNEFLKYASTPASSNTVGLTVARLSYSGKPQPNIEEEDGQVCVSLGAIDIKLGYEDLTVYIDKKYPLSSCEYKVTKRHEKQHVAIYQQAMIFFKPDIEKQVQKSLKQLKPQIVKTPQERDRVLIEQYQKVMDDLLPLIEHINKVTAQKNQQLDSPESYKRTTALCKNW